MPTLSTIHTLSSTTLHQVENGQTLQQFWSPLYGPFQITKALSHVAYQLQLPPSWKIHNVFHASYISPFRKTTEHGRNFIEPPPDIIDGEPEWEVERIIGRWYHGQKKEEQYRVHWKGYSAAHDTWEPATNIHAPELMEQFLHQPPTTIRTAQLGPEDVRMHPSSFREGLLETPERHPLATLAPRPVSPATTVNYAEALAQTYSDRVIPETIRFLEICPKTLPHQEKPIMKKRSNKRGHKVKNANLHPIQDKKETRVTIVSQQICLEELSPSEDLHTEVQSQICVL